jgi:hypothetical protein
MRPVAGHCSAWRQPVGQGLVRQALTIAPRAWRIERLDRLPKYPVPDPEFSCPARRDRRAAPRTGRRCGPSPAIAAPGASRWRQALTIAPRAWRIERLDRLPKYPVPDPEFQRLRPAMSVPE